MNDNDTTPDEASSNRLPQSLGSGDSVEKNLSEDLSEGLPDGLSGNLANARENPSDSSSALPQPRQPQTVLPEDTSHQENPRESSDPADSSSPRMNDQTVVSDQPPMPCQGSSQGIHPIELGNILEGQQLDHYRLEEFVGGGGMGAVFRSIDTTLDRTVAVKVLSAGKAGTEEMLLRFRNEAQSAARLDHENIARVYYVGEDRGIPYIVFEYIEGVNIRDLVVRRGPFPLPEAIEYTLQIAEALAHASMRDVVHRDIKPSNILVTSEGRAKLVDMGLARLHQVEHSADDLTASGVTLGTFDYISPEQARDPRCADVRSDLYSLGCTLFFMLTGQPPFPEGTVLQKLLQHQGDEAPDVCALRPELPQEVSRILQRLLTKLPEDRYQTPEELIAELLVLGRQMGVPVLGNRRTLVVESSPLGTEFLRRHLPWMIPLGLLLITVLVLQGMSQRDANLFDKDSFSQQHGNQTPVRDPEGGSLEKDRQKLLQPKGDSGNDIANTSTRSSDEVASKESEPSREGSNPEGVANRSFEPSAQGANPNKPSPNPGEPLAPKGSQGRARTSPESVEADSPSEGNRDFSSSRRDRLPTAPEPDRLLLPGHGEVFTVNPTGAGGAYRTLREAVDQVHHGDVIKLDFNGPLKTNLLTLTNLQLTIRAGEDYRPKLVFATRSNGELYSRARQSLITVYGGELKLIGIRLEADLREGSSANRWNFFSLHGVKDVLLESCTLTLHTDSSNSEASENGHSFFYAALPWDAESRLFSSLDPQEEPSLLRLKDSIVRGAATFLRSEQRQPVRVLWENGLLLTSQRLLHLDTRHSRQIAVESNRLLPDSFRFPELCDIELRHLTAFMDQGFASILETEDSNPPVALKVRCLDSILSTSREAPMITSWGLDFSVASRRFLWEGDRVFYEHVRNFWACSTSLDLPSATFDFVSWKNHWNQQPEGEEIEPQLDRVRWNALPLSGVPYSRHTPDSYQISTTETENPALRGASDGRNAGMDRRTLSPLFESTLEPLDTEPTSGEEPSDPLGN